MTIEIPDVVFENEKQRQDLKIELAVLLFEKDIFTLGKAAEFAGMYQFDMQKILAERKIPMHYDVEDFMEDVRTLQEINLNDRYK